MGNFDDIVVGQNLFEVISETMVEGLHAKRVKYVSVVIKADLHDCNGLVLNNAFTSKANHIMRLFLQDLLAKAF